MNYIGDDFSWDKLTLVSYPSGFGGDFFCNLLHMNYDPNHTFLPDENNKFNWVVWRHLTDEKNLKFPIKSTNAFLKAHKDKNVLKYTPINFVNFIEKIYHKDFSVYKNNFIQHNRNMLMSTYLKNLHIVNTHYVDPHENFSIYEMFPGASIFFLYTKNVYYTFYFTLLTIIKNDKMCVGSEHLIGSIITDPAYARLVTKTYEPFDNMIPIDAGKLFFENDGYETEAEQILSNSLGKTIVLDRNLLKKYKKDNKDLVKKMMNISENIDTMSCKDIVKIILENYFIDTRLAMTDDKFKLLLKKFEMFL
jgi:hypothetical protein